MFRISKVYPDIGVLWVDAHADINTSGKTSAVRAPKIYMSSYWIW
jgi:arginase family enzyme